MLTCIYVSVELSGNTWMKLQTQTRETSEQLEKQNLCFVALCPGGAGTVDGERKATAAFQ